jgi:hypothetical protein
MKSLRFDSSEDGFCLNEDNALYAIKRRDGSRHILWVTDDNKLVVYDNGYYKGEKVKIYFYNTADKYVHEFRNDDLVSDEIDIYFRNKWELKRR